ncbi:hypothetical protein ASPU41_16765 [Arthrobacter sp. U41]|nr:hypothetical protein ASPU41_16765 [Arthrobacter sp. U41]
MQRTETQIYIEVTTKYLDALDPSSPPSPGEIEVDLVSRTHAAFKYENMFRVPMKANREVSKGIMLTLPQCLANVQVAKIVERLHCVKAVLAAGKERDQAMLAIYHTDGPYEGLYDTSEMGLQSVIARYSPNMNLAGINEIMQRLLREAPVTSVSNGNPVAHLSVVANGIWNHESQMLEPFSPEYVFLARASCIAYDETAQNVLIEMPDGKMWDVESWMTELSDDPEIVELLWELQSAIVRPNVRWNKSAWFYAEMGNNGKGTLSQLMANLVGESSTASLSIKDFGKDFLLEPLITTSAIIVDENDVGTFIDEAASIKAVITNDVFSINRKHKKPIPYRYWGFMVQCLNEFPRIKDKSESFLRRLLLIPFDKCFTGVERTYIKGDYLQRDDVLRYVLKRALQMRHTELSMPALCKAKLDEFREVNDPRILFWREFEDQFVWDLLPFGFIYDLWKAWTLKTNPDGRPGSQTSLTSFLKTHLAKSAKWDHMGTKSMRPARHMSSPEPLIVEYDLRDWTNTSYTGTAVNHRAVPYPLKANYAGLLRCQPVAVAAGDDDEDGTDAIAL